MIKDCFDKMVVELDRWHGEDLYFFPFSSCDNGLDLNLRKLAHANYQVWHYEDIAKLGENDSEVLKAYKMTVIFNRQRNQATEFIEQYFFNLQKEEGEICSETMGMIFDRLSILYLKKLHAQNTSPEKVPLIELQINGLLEAAENLYDGIVSGKKRCLVFSHLKIYSK
jgi:hypothetical protein